MHKHKALSAIERNRQSMLYSRAEAASVQKKGRGGCERDGGRGEGDHPTGIFHFSMTRSMRPTLPRKRLPLWYHIGISPSFGT